MSIATSFSASIAGLVLVVDLSGCARFAPAPSPRSEVEVVVISEIDPRTATRGNVVPNAFEARATRAERTGATLVYDGAASQPGVHRPMAITTTDVAADINDGTVVADHDGALATARETTGVTVVEARVVRSDAELRAILRRNRDEGPPPANR